MHRDNALASIGQGNITIPQIKEFVNDFFKESFKQGEANNRGEVIPRNIDTPVVEQTKSIINVFQSGNRSTIIHKNGGLFYTQRNQEKTTV